MKLVVFDCLGARGELAYRYLKLAIYDPEVWWQAARTLVEKVPAACWESKHRKHTVRREALAQCVVREASVVTSCIVDCRHEVICYVVDHFIDAMLGFHGGL